MEKYAKLFVFSYTVSGGWVPREAGKGLLVFAIDLSPNGSEARARGPIWAARTIVVILLSQEREREHETWR